MPDVKTQVPLTQLVVFELDQEEYAAPILDVTEVIKKSEITPVPQGPKFIQGLINLRGKVVPVVDLEKRFSLKHETDSQAMHVVIVEGQKEGSYVGVLVDRVSQVLKITEDLIKPVPAAITSKIAKDFLKGVIVLQEDNVENGSERILLILDLKKILSTEEIDTIKAVTENSAHIDNTI